MAGDIRDQIKNNLYGRPILYMAIQVFRYCAMKFQKPPFNEHWELSKLTLSKKNINFVQVGANDGRTADLIYPLVKRFGWTGLLVEPVPELFSDLKNNYSDISGLKFERSAVAECKGSLPLYRIISKPELPMLPSWAVGLGSLDKSVLIGHSSQIEGLEQYLVEEEVPTDTLESIMVRHDIDNIDLFIIDVEGYDYHVLKQLDFNKYRPRLIIFESKHLSSDDKLRSYEILKSNNYSYVENYENIIATLH